MRKTFCICENKGTDQLRSHCKADQRLCFRYMDSANPLLSKSKYSSLKPSSLLVQLGMCRTFSHDVSHLCSAHTCSDGPMEI